MAASFFGVRNTVTFGCHVSHKILRQNERGERQDAVHEGLVLQPPPPIATAAPMMIGSTAGDAGSRRSSATTSARTASVRRRRVTKRDTAASPETPDDTRSRESPKSIVTGRWRPSLVQRDGTQGPQSAGHAR